jgi:hypothetical protein
MGGTLADMQLARYINSKAAERVSGSIALRKRIGTGCWVCGVAEKQRYSRSSLRYAQDDKSESVFGVTD